MANKIKNITFLRGNDKTTLRKYVTNEKRNQIVITLKDKIPNLGYGPLEIRKMLKKWDKKYK